MAPIRASRSRSPSVFPFTTATDVEPAPVDRMVKIELEAAEALAGLAGERCWNPGEQVSQRVENEISAGDSVPMSSDLDQDWGVVVPQHFEKRCNMKTKPVKAKHDAELKSNPTFATSYASSGGGKSRQNLTEAEKESRRLRRVLANRESARQTIRRRQALYDELTRKAADLALENDKLKWEKELAVKENDSLRSTNECLKARMTKIVKAEEEETQEESKSTHVDTSTTSSTTCPVFIYNHPSFLPFLWPSMVQPSNPVQSQCGPRIAISTDSFHERENPTNSNGPQTPLYLVPYPWLFPIPHHSNGPDIQSCLNDKRNETSPNKQSPTTSSSKPVVHVESCHSLMPINHETKPSTSTIAVPENNIHENPFGFPPDGGGLYPRGMILVSAPLSCVGTASTFEYDSNPRPEPTCDVKANQPAACDIVEEPIMVVDAFAAAEARKRRKALKRVKNLHCRY